MLSYRLAALYIVERLKSEVITSAITHYQHIAVLQARRQIIKRILNRQKVKHPDQHKVRHCHCYLAWPNRQSYPGLPKGQAPRSAQGKLLSLSPCMAKSGVEGARGNGRVGGGGGRGGSLVSV